MSYLLSIIYGTNEPQKVRAWHVLSLAILPSPACLSVRMEQPFFVIHSGIFSGLLYRPAVTSFCSRNHADWPWDAVLEQINRDWCRSIQFSPAQYLALGLSPNTRLLRAWLGYASRDPQIAQCWRAKTFALLRPWCCRAARLFTRRKFFFKNSYRNWKVAVSA